jgi:hypothetical protein
LASGDGLEASPATADAASTSDETTTSFPILVMFDLLEKCGDYTHN